MSNHVNCRFKKLGLCTAPTSDFEVSDPIFGFRLVLNAQHPLLRWCVFLRYLKICFKFLSNFNLKLSACKGL